MLGVAAFVLFQFCKLGLEGLDCRFGTFLRGVRFFFIHRKDERLERLLQGGLCLLDVGLQELVVFGGLPDEFDELVLFDLNLGGRALGRGALGGNGVNELLEVRALLARLAVVLDRGAAL